MLRHEEPGGLERRELDLAAILDLTPGLHISEGTRVRGDARHRAYISETTPLIGVRQTDGVQDSIDLD
jgi:hypothetical protein